MLIAMGEVLMAMVEVLVAMLILAYGLVVVVLMIIWKLVLFCCLLATGFLWDGSKR